MDAAFHNDLFLLLEKNREREDVADCLEACAETEAVKFPSKSTLVPLKEAFDIYSTRARINAAKGGTVKGYETLLPSLQKAEVQNVRIHALELLKKWYVIFTDDAVSQLFGLLERPKKQAAWFNPPTGYK